MAPVATAAASTRTPAQWLEAMDHAFRDLDYDGVFSYYIVNQGAASQVPGSVFANGAQAPRDHVLGFSTSSHTATKLATFRIVHKAVDGVERERILHLNGPHREILRTGDSIAYILQPGDELLNLEGAIPAGSYARVFARRFEDVSAYYQVGFSGRDRVADRPVVRLSVAPRDNARFGYRLWLDEATALLLRSELRDAAGANLEIFQFTSLRTGDEVAVADLDAATEGTLVRHLSTPSKAPPARPDPLAWRARWVPPGFRMTGADVHRPADDPKDVNTLTYSDGLAAFSVFVEAMPRSGAGSVVSRSGATVVLTHLLPGVGGDHLVTVVGEVPVATARRVAAGVYYKR